MLCHFETETYVTTRVQLDQMAMECEFFKDYIIPGCEAHLQRGDRRRYQAIPVFNQNTQRFGCGQCDRYFPKDVGLAEHLKSSIHHPLAYRCAGCSLEFADLSALLAHVEVSKCSEGISYGTQSIGQLLHMLWQKLPVQDRQSKDRQLSGGALRYPDDGQPSHFP